METFKPPGAPTFYDFFTDFLSIPPTTTTATSIPQVLANLVRSFRPSKVINDTSGSNTYSYSQKGSTIGLMTGNAVNKGNYGFLYDVLRNEKSGYLLKCGPRSLKEEACLQQAAYYILREFGMPWAVPRVYDIVEHPRHGVCFTMDNVEPLLIFGDYLINTIEWKRQSRFNDILVFEVISQLAIYMLILEAQLGLNHRDLKPNNVLMVKQEPLADVLIHCSTHVKIHLSASVRAVLIDFGFACIGDLDRPRLLLSANEFIPNAVDMCPKVGRDMFLIFANLWNVRPFRKAVSPEAALLFKRWLTDVRGKDWALWLSSDIDKELVQTYNMVNNANFQAPWSRPISVLTDIANAYPEILRID